MDQNLISYCFQPTPSRIASVYSLKVYFCLLSPSSENESSSRMSHPLAIRSTKLSVPPILEVSFAIGKTVMKRFCCRILGSVLRMKCISGAENCTRNERFLKHPPNQSINQAFGMNSRRSLKNEQLVAVITSRALFYTLNAFIRGNRRVQDERDFSRRFDECAKLHLRSDIHVCNIYCMQSHRVRRLDVRSSMSVISETT